MRLRSKIAIYLSVVIVMILAFSAAVTVSRVGDTLERDSLAAVAGVLNLVEVKVESQLSTYSDFVRNLSLSREVRRDFFRRDWSALEKKLKGVFSPVREIFKNGFFVLDKEGNLVCDYPPFPATRWRNFAFREYFRDCKKSKDVAVSPPYFSARTGRKVLTFAAPFLDEAGDFMGLVAASVWLEDTELVDSISRVTLHTGGRIGLFTKDGIEIYSPFEGKNGKRPLSRASSKGNLSRIPVISRYETEKGKQLVVLSTTLSGTGWILEARVPEEELFLPLRKVTNSFLAIILGAIGLAFATSIVLSHTIVSRIEKLKNALSEMEFESEKFPFVDEEGSDEIADLIRGFNRMSEELGKRTRELKESKELFQGVIASINEYIYRVEVDGRKFRTVLVSDRAKDITGYGPEEFIENYRLWIEIVHPEDRKKVLKTFIHQVLKTEQSSATYRIIHKNGSVRYVQNSVRVIFDKDGNPVSLNGTVVDMTEKVLLEQQLQQSQKIRAIGMLAGGIAHDFNNILSGILGYVSMLKERLSSHPELEGETRRALSIIESSAERGAELTKQLLGFAMKGKYAPTVINLNDLVKENIEMVKRTIGKRITVVGHLDEDLPNVKADPAQILQVLMNLCINARDAMPDGGELTVMTRKDPPIPFEFMESFRNVPDGVVLLAVQDTGVGMDEETLSRAFEPFYTTKEQGRGTGLGLPTVYGIVKNHGGEIAIESRPRGGTVVRIYLPATSEPLGKRSSTERREKGNDEPLTVMVVDDEVYVREFLAEAVKVLGHRVVECSSGAEALGYYDEEDGDVDLVILDMLMPGMDGKETFIRLREKVPGIKVIIASGYLHDEDAEELLRRGVDAILKKPFKIDELRKTIDSVAGRLQAM